MIFVYVILDDWIVSIVSNIGNNSNRSNVIKTNIRNVKYDRIYSFILFIRMDPQNSNEQPIATSADGTLNEARHLRSQKKRPKADISGGWTDLTLRNSYLAGALKHAVYKPRGKPSDVWTRGIFAIYKADDAIVPDWYICKRKDEMMNDCNQLFNIKLRDGNSRLREHCDKHDQKENQEKFFRISYDQMVSALDKANLFGDNYGVVSFRQLLPRPEVMEIW